jgi:D-3-phosphoglycerate dehydrogenase
MRILIADKFESVGIDGLKRLAEHVDYEPGAKGDDLTRRVAELDPDVIVVRSNKVPAATLKAGKGLRLVIRAGSGFDTIDVATASQLGIMVANCPGQNAVAVAELTLGLILALDRRIPENVIDARARRWNKQLYSKQALGLKGLTLGIVGAGKIGSEVARRALACDMNVLYFNLGRTRRLTDFPQARRVEIDDLLRGADVVSIHVPGGDNTRNLLDARRIGLLKPSALLINTARADVIDEAALFTALREGRIRGAAVDVFNGEPAADAKAFDAPACDVPNLYVTHHIGASTMQAQVAVAEDVVRIVEEFKRTGKAPNCVNMRSPSDSVMLVLRLVNRPGSLAHVFTQLAAEEINVEEMDHVIYDGGAAACAHIRVSKAPSQGLVTRLAMGHPNVLGVEVLQTD